MALNQKVASICEAEFQSKGYAITLSLEEQAHYWLGFAYQALCGIDALIKEKENERAKNSTLNDCVKYAFRRYKAITNEINKKKYYVSRGKEIMQ